MLLEVLRVGRDNGIPAVSGLLLPPVSSIRSPLQGRAPGPDRVEPVPQGPVTQFLRVDVDPATGRKELLEPREDRADQVIICLKDTSDNRLNSQSVRNPE